MEYFVLHSCIVSSKITKKLIVKKDQIVTVERLIESVRRVYKLIFHHKGGNQKNILILLHIIIRISFRFQFSL